MTENLASAGRGEGLAGLAEAIKLAISAGADLRYDEYGVMEMPIGHLATKWDIAQAELQRILAALEAAAPAGAARRSKLELSIAEECLKPAIHLLNDAIWNYRETVTIKRGDLNYAVELAREALATPSPQAPAADIESLAATFHAVYQSEARRQGDVRHKDAYADLTENVKEFDRVLARYVLLNFEVPAATQEQPAGSAQVVTDLQIALRIIGDWKEDSRGLVHVHKDVIRKAIVAALRSAGNCGSPRKVGEDGAQPTFTDALKWLLKQGHIMGIRDYPTGLSIAEAMIEELCEPRDVVSITQALARSSSVPVGEQK